jgi:hypothetical protein
MMNAHDMLSKHSCKSQQLAMMVAAPVASLLTAPSLAAKEGWRNRLARIAYELMSSEQQRDHSPDDGPKTSNATDGWKARSGRSAGQMYGQPSQWSAACSGNQKHHHHHHHHHHLVLPHRLH